jgi:hypothetical protein
MHRGFTKGLVWGSLIGASISMAMGSDMMRPSTRRRMMRTGRTFMRKSGGIISDVLDIIR